MISISITFTSLIIASIAAYNWIHSIIHQTLAIDWLIQTWLLSTLQSVNHTQSNHTQHPHQPVNDCSVLILILSFDTNLVPHPSSWFHPHYQSIGVVWFHPSINNLNNSNLTTSITKRCKMGRKGRRRNERAKQRKQIYDQRRKERKEADPKKGFSRESQSLPQTTSRWKEECRWQTWRRTKKTTTITKTPSSSTSPKPQRRARSKIAL